MSISIRILTLPIPFLTLLAMTISGVMSIYAANLFVLLFLRLKPSPLKESPSNLSPSSKWPSVTIQIPIYNEGELLKEVFHNIVTLDYPRNLLQIQILDDSTNPRTRQYEKELQHKFEAEGFRYQEVHREQRRVYKAGALNFGLSHVKSDFIAIFDVDTVVPRSFLKETIPFFTQDPQLAFIQTRCSYTNRWHNWITGAHAIERDIHSIIEQPVKSLYNLLPNFSGQAGIWRTTVLTQCRWDENVITEDIELSYRVQAEGWNGLYYDGVTSQIELPPSLTDLKQQQQRWTTGFAQSFRKLWPIVITSANLNRIQKLEALLSLSIPFVHIIALTAIILWTLAAIIEPDATFDVWLGSKSVSYLLLPISTGSILATIIAIFYNTQNKRKIRTITTIPITLTLITAYLITNVKGALAGFFGINIAFQSTKKYGNTSQTTNTGEWTYSSSSVRSRIQHNMLELLAILLTGIGIILIILRGNAISAMPLGFIFFAWLVSVLKR
ncbi:MAG: glycosyltransferase [Candidatus Bathyarchaeota archaeon]|nr:MAG: glycosyltransferase [Candidatus Bathyarchaeota archaeon]